MNKKSAAQILMVNNDATFEQIKYNYRKLALELHPDKNNGQNSGKQKNCNSRKQIRLLRWELWGLRI